MLSIASIHQTMPGFPLYSLVFLLNVLSMPVLSEFNLSSGHETTFIVSEELPSPERKSADVKLTPKGHEGAFPNECRTDKLSTGAVILCRDRLAWERGVNRLFPKANGPRRSFEKRVVKKTDGNLEDCLLHRRQPRPYPHYCYSRGNFSLEEFANQWRMIRGDLMYTFDFVLYDQKHANRKENQLWYLMYYLKELVVHIDNPIDLVQAVKTRDFTAKNVDVAWRNRLAKRNLKDLNDRVERLEKLVQRTSRWTVYN